MAATKKHEIIRVAQENLYMLKRLNEKTSAYNVDKWKKDYEASQYYKRSHCQYPSIDFYKTQKCNSFGNMFTGISKNSTKNDFYTKTQYSKYSYSNTNNKGNTNKKRKRFEDFSYRDLQLLINFAKTLPPIEIIRRCNSKYKLEEDVFKSEFEEKVEGHRIVVIEKKYKIRRYVDYNGKESFSPRKIIKMILILIILILISK